jgi:hypothetical protein
MYNLVESSLIFPFTNYARGYCNLLTCFVKKARETERILCLKLNKSFNKDFSETALELLYCCCCKHELTIYDNIARDVAKEAKQLMLLY